MAGAKSGRGKRGEFFSGRDLGGGERGVWGEGGTGGEVWKFAGDWRIGMAADGRDRVVTRGELEDELGKLREEWREAKGEKKRKREEEGWRVAEVVEEFRGLRERWRGKLTEPSAGRKMGEVIGAVWRSRGGEKHMGQLYGERAGTEKELEVVIEGPETKAKETSKETGPWKVGEVEVRGDERDYLGLWPWWGVRPLMGRRHVVLQDMWAKIVGREEVDEEEARWLVRAGLDALWELEGKVRDRSSGGWTYAGAKLPHGREASKVTIKVEVRESTRKGANEGEWVRYGSEAKTWKEPKQREMEVYVQVYVE